METEIQGKLFKAGSLWATIGVSSWAEAANFMTFVASFVACLYSLALFGEWLWKKAIKPALIERGFIKAVRRRKGDRDE